MVSVSTSDAGPSSQSGKHVLRQLPLCLFFFFFRGAAEEAVSFSHQCQLIISGPLLFNTLRLSPPGPPAALHSESSPWLVLIRDAGYASRLVYLPDSLFLPVFPYLPLFVSPLAFAECLSKHSVK